MGRSGSPVNPYSGLASLYAAASLTIFLTICAGVSPAQGLDPLARQSATVPATMGEAKLVPALTPYSPPGAVVTMQTPGAARVCAWSAASVAKLLKLAGLSSAPSSWQPDARSPPG